jgi:5-methylcytosine-specific restriction endonuclease McrA
VTLPAALADMFLPYTPYQLPPRKKAWDSNNRPLMVRMLEAQGGFCGICGARLKRSPSYDHVIPKCRGGKNMRNRIVAHIGCNFQKGDRMPTGCELIMLEAVNTRIVYTHDLLQKEHISA